MAPLRCCQNCSSGTYAAVAWDTLGCLARGSRSTASCRSDLSLRWSRDLTRRSKDSSRVFAAAALGSASVPLPVKRILPRMAGAAASSLAGASSESLDSARFLFLLSRLVCVYMGGDGLLAAALGRLWAGGEAECWRLDLWRVRVGDGESLRSCEASLSSCFFFFSFLCLSFLETQGNCGDSLQCQLPRSAGILNLELVCFQASVSNQRHSVLWDALGLPHGDCCAQNDWQVDLSSGGASTLQTSPTHRILSTQCIQCRAYSTGDARS